MNVEYDSFDRDTRMIRNRTEPDSVYADLVLLADELDTIPREGETVDQPEGRRYAVVSDTLLKRIAMSLRAVVQRGGA